MFALRNPKGELGAYHNVCSHQRMGVLENGSGHVASLSCKFHGWTYDLDGRFVSAPPLVAPERPDPEANGLRRIAVESWQGLVFVCVSGGAEPLADSVAQLSQHPRLDSMGFRSEVTTDLGCNWKVYVEYALEAGWCWDWPALIVRFASGHAEVQQVIPRTFSRTRVVQYFFNLDTLEAAKVRMALAKSACEDAQKGIEQGVLPPATTPLVEGFRARIRHLNAREF